jgi:hypothetical protein
MLRLLVRHYSRHALSVFGYTRRIGIGCTVDVTGAQHDKGKVTATADTVTGDMDNSRESILGIFVFPSQKNNNV